MELDVIPTTAIVGDIIPSDGVPKVEKSRKEQEALNEMCEVLGGGMRADEKKGLWIEYETNSSLEANLVKDFDKVVPDDASRLANFQKIMNTCSEFESVLKKLSFISTSDKNDEGLSNFADNVEVHFTVRKKTEILASARESVLCCDFSIPQDVCVSSLRVALEFYQAA